MHFKFRHLLVTAAVCIVFALSATAVFADPITVNVGGNNVTGTIVAGAGTVTITLNNNLTNAQVQDVTNNISAVYFQVSGYNLGAVTLQPGTAQSTIVAANGSAALNGVIPTGWAAGHSGTTVTVCVVCAFGVGPTAGPANTIIGGTGVGTACPGGTGYCSANGSITGNGPHNPFLVGQVIFTLNVPGVTAGSQFSNVVVQFGTVATPPTTNVPEPTSMFLLGSGLIGAAGAVRRRRNKLS